MQTVCLKDYVPPAFLVDAVFLEFELDDSSTVVRSRLQVRVNPDRVNPAADPAKRVFVLSGEVLDTLQLKLEGVLLAEGSYRIADNTLTVFSVPDYFVFEAEVRIRPQDNTALSGLYQSGGNYCTQCEAEGFRRITWFLDRPDVMSRYSVTITADAARYPVLLSNGNLTDRGQHANGRHWVRWEDPFPKPSYLFALVAGDFDCLDDVFCTQSGRNVTLRIYTERGQREKSRFAMQALKKAMRWDEEQYGREYDLDVFMIVAVSDFNMGAMENKGLNIFNAKYILTSPDTATDHDCIQVESVIAHEYFHNWTGNRITCRDWFQLSLKEGLTVFRDQCFTADTAAASIARIEDVDDLRNSQFPEDEGPLAHPVQPDTYMEIDNFYTATVYNKGAEVIRMIRTLLGLKNFRKGMDLYFSRHDGQAVTIEEFVQAHEDASGVDLTQFRLWYHQAGTPHLEVEDAYDPEAGVYTLSIRQHTPPTPGQPHKKPLQIPLLTGLLDKTGREVANELLVLSRAEQTFVFRDVATQPVLSLARDFSAPVRIHHDCSDTALALLLVHDTDVFNRREAGFQYATRCLLRMIDMPIKKTPPELLAAFQHVFQTAGDDPWLLAKMLLLPGEKYLAQQMAVIDVEGIHAAREAMRHDMAQHLRSVLAENWHALKPADDTDQTEEKFDIQVAGKRSLKNVCLYYLARLPDRKIHEEMIMKQFHAALGHNMTDTIGALQAINDIPGELRDEAFLAFLGKWQEEALVMDKWFALQAASHLPDTCSRVESLLNHPRFDLLRPNCVYALLGTFGNNDFIFHAADGSGYQLLADYVKRLDKLNPQVAARMVRPLTSLQRHAPAKQKSMAAILEELAALPSLSSNLHELVTKSLAVGVCA